MWKKGWIVFLTLSVIGNVYLAYENHVQKRSMASEQDRKILGEMTVKVLHSKAYKKIAEEEKVYSIDEVVSRENWSTDRSIYDYVVNVQTDHLTYSFSCDDDQCTSVTNERTSYSPYSEENN